MLLYRREGISGCCIKKCVVLNQILDFDRVVHSLKSTCFTTFYSFKSKNVFSPIFSKSDINLLRNLGRDDSVVACSPDKGRGVVILNRAEYVSKMDDILSDAAKFEKLPHADSFLTSVRLEDRINNFLRSLKDTNIISDSTYKSLYASGSSPGI